MTVTATGSVATETSSYYDQATSYGHATTAGFLNRLFLSCAREPRPSVHRVWGLILISLVLFFVVSILEMLNLKAGNGSRALVMISIFMGVMHLLLGILGTFVLKRFPTSFSIGFFMGVLVVLANQNIILSATFYRYPHGKTRRTNHLFANMSLLLFVVLTYFTLMLYHFRGNIVVTPGETKHHHAKRRQEQQPHVTVLDDQATFSDYSQYDDQA